MGRGERRNGELDRERATLLEQTKEEALRRAPKHREYCSCREAVPSSRLAGGTARISLESLRGRRKVKDSKGSKLPPVPTTS